MTDTATRTPRQRLIDAASELFYRQGTGAVGVDLVSKAAGVSKRTLYQLFGSKDQLIAECLDANGMAIVGQYLSPDDGDRPPREQVLGVFDRLGDWTGSEAFRGCPFINTATEIADAAHPARRIAKGYKILLRDYFAAQAELGRADDPQLLADQLIIAFDGAIVQAVMGTAQRPEAARSTAQALLDAQHLS
jgi:AcrR family transcriptional regulator